MQYALVFIIINIDVLVFFQAYTVINTTVLSLVKMCEKQ